jgi:hypothetical protein
MLGGGMIVKMFKRGAGGGSGPVNYLLGNNRNREGATLLRGDPDEIKALIDSSKYAQKYTSGVLSFEEADIPEAAKQRLMDSFEGALLPALDKDQYSVLWVEHRDKGRLELNFVVPNLELQTGKRLQVYFHAQDRYRLRDWQTIQNIEGGFQDPDDPLKRQLVTLPNNLPADRKEAQLAITHGIKALVESGDIRNRNDVIKTLQESGFSVVRAIEKSISIAPSGGGKNIRLKGMFYEQGFSIGDGASLESEIRRESETYRGNRLQRLSKSRESYQRGFEQKYGINIERYKRPEQGLAHSFEQQERRPLEGPEQSDRHVQHEQRDSKKSPLQELGDYSDRAGISPALGLRGPLVSGQNDPRQLGRNSGAEPAETRAGTLQRGGWEGRRRAISGIAQKERDHENLHIGQWLSSGAVGGVNDRTRTNHDPSVAGHAEDFQSRSGRFRALIQRGFERIRGTIFAARATLGTRTRNLCEGTSELTKHVQSSISGERPLERSSERFDRANGDFNQAVKQFERVIEHRKELELQRARSVSKGMYR